MLINGNKGITFGKLKIDLHSVSVCKGLLVAKGRRLGLNFRIDAIELGSYAVVVGSSITRPQLITKGYAEAVNSVEKETTV